MRKKLNEIQKKQQELEAWQSESASALDMITATILRLDTVNEGITNALNEIKEMRNALDTTECGLRETMVKNSNIASKFKVLIEG